MKTLNKTLNFVLALVLVVGIAPAAFAQTAPTFTTTTAAIATNTTTSTINITLTSTTGISATACNQDDCYLLIDSELFRVTAIPASGTATAVRAQRNTIQTPHASGAYAVFGGFAGTQWLNRQTGSPTFGVFIGGGVNPVGACTLTSQQYSPIFVLNPPSISGGPVTVTPKICGGGGVGGSVWISGIVPDGKLRTPTLATTCTVPIGSVAYGSFGTSTTASTTGEFTASIFVPYTQVLTGFTNLNGSAVDGASKKIFILRIPSSSTTARAIANTATAGTAASGNDAFQAIAFTTPVIAVGPATYFVGLQDDTADVNGVRTIAASTFNGVYASSITSVFGTVAASVTTPTTFTADVGPIGCVY